MSRKGVSILKSILAGVIAAVACVAGPCSALSQKLETKVVTVFAAASLKTALDAASADYQQRSGVTVLVSYAASSVLAKQIEQSAPADVFISADLEWMQYLSQKGLIREETRGNLVGNRLVLIAPAESQVSLKIAPGFALAEAVGDGRLAMGDVKSVPAGKYGKSALEKLGVWAALEPKLAQAENVRAALALVARGEVPLGIVYQTDAKAEPKVKIVDTFPHDTHAPIIYPIAITAAAPNADAATAFVSYLRSDHAKARFEHEGFTVLKN